MQAGRTSWTPEGFTPVPELKHLHRTAETGKGDSSLWLLVNRRGEKRCYLLRSVEFHFPHATIPLCSTPSPDYSDRKFQLHTFLCQLFLLPCYHPILPFGNRCPSKDFLNIFTTSTQSVAATKPIPMTKNKQQGMTTSTADRHKTHAGLLILYHTTCPV